MPYKTLLSLDIDWKDNSNANNSIKYNLFLNQKGIKVKKIIQPQINGKRNEKTTICLKVREYKNIKMKRRVKVDPTKRSQISVRKSKRTSTNEKQRQLHPTKKELSIVDDMKRLTIKRIRSDSTEENTAVKRRRIDPSK